MSLTNPQTPDKEGESIVVYNLKQITYVHATNGTPTEPTPQITNGTPTEPTPQIEPSLEFEARFQL